ncbi:hypothetical protein Lal_00018802 [Lupinus albus]|nr:hypothetical protein Lal_00018802 [Lupinus albus]
MAAVVMRLEAVSDAPLDIGSLLPVQLTQSISLTFWCSIVVVVAIDETPLLLSQKHHDADLMGEWLKCMR